MPKHIKKKGVSKRAVKVALKQVREGQKRKATAKKVVSGKVKNMSILRTRQSARAKRIRESDAAMRARRKAFKNK